MTRYRYDVQPAIWPVGLPHSYYWGGAYYNLMWDPFYRGYGWYGPGGSWVYYDDVMGAAPAVEGAAIGRAVVVRSAFPWVGFWWAMASLFMLIVLIWLFTRDWGDTTYETVTTTTTTTTYDCPIRYAPTQEFAEPVAPKATVWQKLRGNADITTAQPNSKLLLSDGLSIDDAKKLDPDAKALEVSVDHTVHVRERQKLAGWTLIFGVSEIGQEVLIMVKDVDGNRSVCCYTRDIDGSRWDLIERGERWLFCAPQANQSESDLAFTAWFDRKLDGQYEDRYERKRQGELHGLALCNPPRSGQEKMIATIVEYACARPQVCDQYLVFELGTEKGSIVEGWWGAEIKPSEVKLA